MKNKNCLDFDQNYYSAIFFFKIWVQPFSQKNHFGSSKQLKNMIKTPRLSLTKLYQPFKIEEGYNLQKRLITYKSFFKEVRAKLCKMFLNNKLILHILKNTADFDVIISSIEPLVLALFSNYQKMLTC